MWVVRHVSDSGVRTYLPYKRRSLSETTDCAPRAWQFDHPASAQPWADLYSLVCRKPFEVVARVRAPSAKAAA